MHTLTQAPGEAQPCCPTHDLVAAEPVVSNSPVASQGPRAKRGVVSPPTQGPQGRTGSCGTRRHCPRPLPSMHLGRRVGLAPPLSPPCPASARLSRPVLHCPCPLPEGEPFRAAQAEQYDISVEL